MTGSTDKMPTPGELLQIRPGLQSVLAPNASPMTFWGTNTFIIGEQDVVVIDPGPDNKEHLRNLLTALSGRTVHHILITHSHLDHSGLVGALRDATNAPVLGFGNSRAGRSEVMERLIHAGMVEGGEGVDHDFQPDHCLEDGSSIEGSWGRITAIHTPGHMANHMCFHWQDAIFTGDHVMGWASSLISPPDGDLTQFMESCRRLSQIDCSIYYPAHGAQITDPAKRLVWLIRHRQEREMQILEKLLARAMTIPALTESLYSDVPEHLQRVAQRNVFSHLIDLVQRGKIQAVPEINLDAKYHFIEGSGG
ncbi:MBL fold metallo-hydrolase [Loktanella sp. S4079]|uniref:MBL fold metallo-hydrolase n=1 Tax=Loktanella sp. S4079 TaxID=579483 RepID=UPI0005FA8A90|nr:MBL fold metallo-hydrolase [Loktanella sp. S4079]KJZ20082.1 metallo-beta-lactamase [Loktanella sp. S4079]